jgi:DNA-binding winged helix-turn-helix (wHTH) protein/TolB-like protein/tetratricopeptide (TPR) repeat protein
MSPELWTGQVFRFGVFEANVAEKTLTRKGVRVKIQDQPFRVLAFLLERSGEIVSRQELRQELWPDGVHVDFDGSLNVILKKLRAALGDNPDNPVFIETVPRRGYRFIAPVASQDLSEAEGSAKNTLLPDVPAAPITDDKSPSISRKLWFVVALVLALALVAAWRITARRNPTRAPAVRVAIAVLPFSNLGAGTDFDYLRFAIANDLVNDLMPARSVSVRPSASTTRFASQPVDPAVAGKELQVTYVVTGAFLLQGKTLRVNMEVIDVERNQPVWSDELTLSPQQLVAFHEQLAERTAHGLLPAINVVSAPPDQMPTPRNEQALDLFLHSLSIPLDPGPNQLAITNLEKSVALDDQYGPAWEELEWRYYIDYSYGNGGEAALAKALKSAHQAGLFPNSTANSITIRVEQGDLEGAYREAKTLLSKRPEVGSFHYEMSYVLRYAGLLEEAGKECDAALALDPGYNLYRSCATPFIFMGDYDHASRYIRLDEHSGFAAKLRLLIALRTGNTAAALAEAKPASESSYKFADVVRLYLSHAPKAQVQKAVAELEADSRSARDPEVLYLSAAGLSYSHQTDAALRQLRKAIHGNHCSYPDMDKEPMFDAIRRRPEFAQLRQAGIECQSRFVSARQRIDAER